ncbi:retinitis pigmentosa 1-like 1 protein [Girardinichthys multiradiatus]|uniref:retinitis pigmentosa 1-like 1 protein n=1 Tax=Girardinichthys multiradiatus TaxID=208333 RepID=UPI001FAE001A|nr:retinitis pigmentosa 1-like 1 protein [Girardinichthys multiradiatus]
MSCHKHNFHCFSAVGREGYHKSSLPFEHHTTWLPRIPQHGMAAYHELEQECRLCSTYRHVQTLEDAENQLLPFYHTHPPYHHQPHQYVLRGPSGHEETHSANECHLHDRRNNKKIVLVKNSDPSFKKTIMLHFRGLHSFGLFLEEVSELMQYHIRKLYTQEGYKVDSIQSLLHCPGVLICVGREPSHPLIMDNFDKTSSYTLPKLSGKSRATEHTEGKERLTAKTSIILPNLEDDNRATKHSVSSGKSVPDGRDSADIVNSCPPGGDSMRDDDIEKQAPHVQHKSEEDLEKQAMDDSELRTQSSLSALSTVSAELKTLAQEASEEDNQNTAEENEKDSEPRYVTETGGYICESNQCFVIKIQYIYKI